MTTPTFVAKADTVDIGGGTDITMTMPSGVQEGDRLWAFIFMPDGSDPLVCSGWTSMSTNYKRFYTKEATAGEPSTYTFTSSTPLEIRMGRIAAYRNWGDLGYSSFTSPTWRTGFGVGSYDGGYNHADYTGTWAGVTSTTDPTDYYEVRNVPWVIFSISALYSLSAPTQFTQAPWTSRGTLTQTLAPSTLYGQDVTFAIDSWDLLDWPNPWVPPALAHTSAETLTSPVVNNLGYGFIMNAPVTLVDRHPAAQGTDSWQAL